ncbi:hypothetical protein EIN_389810 [Entamoeba invadens IP1]|uniref:Uncharacterized protein n=1 Tax=Entamoeba invadens IP1 TaxID=370355 RepID=A0A0A1UB31_ENTIV|nr:hypothetical protein EIN_389810 [Entamoeba invadens IP1]ELP89396.1 hypothetical protein EIN_389810 [Entamoeba invadens IP1]|eukprot:XP_004256167.1 hypothetical protein EIN_389810 [Entamoeba invadens IP1]
MNNDSVHTTISLMDMIKYKIDIPNTWSEGPDFGETVYFEEQKQEEQSDSLQVQQDTQKVGPSEVLDETNNNKKCPIQYTRKAKLDTTLVGATKITSEKKPRQDKTTLFKKKLFVGSEDEIKKQILFVTNELEKRKDDGVNTENAIIEISKPFDAHQHKNDIIDLRTSNRTLTFPNDVPIQAQKLKHRPVPLRQTKNIYHFPGTEAGFDSIKEYKLMKLNADIKELEATKLLIHELDKTIESGN